MLKITSINFAFPTFILEVKHNGSQITAAQFLSDQQQAKQITASDELTQAILHQLDCYLKNPNFQFSLPLHPQGTRHQQLVWQQMLNIKCGTTLSYGQLARQINSSARAVGGACGANPYPILIPCHRVIASGNRLGGFNNGKLAFNLAVKEWLLAHEGYQFTT